MRNFPRIRRGTAALAALVLGLPLAITGCREAMIAVRAVASRAPAATPFFEEALGLGADLLIDQVFALDGGTKKGDEPGLYGGTSQKKSCNKKKLVRFLRDPAHRQKALQWAAVEGIGVDEIEEFVGDLTAVVLRNDTLVKNHDYRKGRAVPYDALLEAGIAVLVDSFGEPVVKCSCGNPLGAFEHDPARADVSPQGRWPQYDATKVVKVERAVRDRPVRTYRLVDVEADDAGLERQAGTDGDRDRSLSDDPGSTGNEEDAGTPAESPVMSTDPEAPSSAPAESAPPDVTDPAGVPTAAAEPEPAVQPS